GPAQIAIDEQDAMSLLRKGQRVVRARETFSFAGQRAGKQKNTTFLFRSEKGEGGAQIAEAFGRGTFRRFRNEPISGAASRQRLRCRGSGGLATFYFRHRRENR